MTGADRQRIMMLIGSQYWAGSFEADSARFAQPYPPRMARKCYRLEDSMHVAVGPQATGTDDRCRCG